MVNEICRKLGLIENVDLVTRAATSVRYWVAHKSWRLRDHFKFLGISSYFILMQANDINPITVRKIGRIPFHPSVQLDP